MGSLSDAATEATLLASRALLGVVARSVSGALDVVTLPQFRVLVVLRTLGPLRFGALALRMRANPSTFSRSIDRMVAGGWVDRSPSPDSRREVLVSLTEAGTRLVDDVTDRRHRELAAILARLTSEEQESVQIAFELFAAAAGEPLAQELLVLGL